MGNNVSKKYRNNTQTKKNTDLCNNKSIVIYLSFLNQKKMFTLDYISVHRDEAYLIFKKIIILKK